MLLFNPRDVRLFNSEKGFTHSHVVTTRVFHCARGFLIRNEYYISATITRGNIVDAAEYTASRVQLAVLGEIMNECVLDIYPSW